jgi:hypothetical protein
MLILLQFSERRFKKQYFEQQKVLKSAKRRNLFEPGGKRYFPYDRSGEPVRDHEDVGTTHCISSCGGICRPADSRKFLIGLALPYLYFILLERKD